MNRGVCEEASDDSKDVIIGLADIRTTTLIDGEFVGSKLIALG